MSNLFDDESDEAEYQAQTAPVENQQPTEYQTQDQYQHDQNQDEYNPYNQSHDQQTAPEEYNPYIEPVQQQQQYDAVQPTQQSLNNNEKQATPAATTTVGAKANHSLADKRLYEAAQAAKNQLMSQIDNFNYIQESSGQNGESFEAEDSASHLFGVTNPVKVGSVVKYTVTGQDDEGRFEVQRRYNEFHILHETLTERWPGCFVPCIPEKQILGDNEPGFIEERRSLLNRFFYECSKFQFILKSQEFKIFSRQPGEVGETLEKLPKQTPTQILEKYRLNFKIDEQQDNSEVARYREKINVFNQFLCKAILSMNKDRLMMNGAATQYQKTYDHYASCYQQFIEFEDCAVDFFCDGNRDNRVLTHEAAGDMQTKLKETITCYKSPFSEAALWIKGEMLDIQGMIDALKGREKIMKKMIEKEGSRRDDQEELEKLSLGKTTLKSFFKSKSGKEQDILNLQARIESANVDIEDYRRLINFVTIYHGQLAIERFKKQKMQQYQKMLQNMATRSINNSYLTATLNSGILAVFEQLK